MTHTVAVAQFEGPLGILLELVEHGKMEVTQISVAQITAGYLARIKQLDDRTPEELSEFLQMGARLLYIKSLALLPQTTADEQGEELRKLNLELEEYKRMQAAARELARRGSSRTWQRTTTERLELHDLPLPQLELTQLGEAFTRALKRAEPARPTAVIRNHVSLETTIKQLRSKLADGQLDLQALLDNTRNRLEIIITFLALLELIKEGAARVVQANQFAAITVEAIHA